MNDQIGSIIKQIRKTQGITLQMLSEETGLSVGYLSLLERGLNSPTIANLQRICNCLKITFNELLSNLDNSPICVRKEDRRVIFKDDGKVLYEATTEGNRHITSICLTVYDDAEHISDRHISDEYGYIVSGSMDMCVNGVVYSLSAGDSLYINANSAHSFRKTSVETCVSIWCYHNIATSANQYPISTLNT